MISETDRTSEKNTAKKKARRRKPWVFPIVLLLCVLICASGAAVLWLWYAPAVYTDAEVNAYVRTIYGDSWTLQKRGPAADGLGREYLYAQDNGMRFSVFSMSVPVYDRNGVASGRFRKALYDNYFSTVIEGKMEELQELAEKYSEGGGPVLEIEETGESAGAYGAQYAFCLYLNKGDQIHKAAELLSRLDLLLAFSCRAGENPYAQMRPQTPCVKIFLRPEGWLSEGADAVTAAAGDSESARRNLFVDWRGEEGRETFRISRISLTDAGSSSRLKKEDAEARLENDYVDAAKTFGKSWYTITEELWNKYPAPVLTLSNVGGHVLTGSEDTDCPFTYRFVYHRRTGTYWMTGLDPCEDYDGNPYGDYPRRGAFGWLVKSLGGSFTGGRWTGSWRIGTNRWEAALRTQKTKEGTLAYRSMDLYRNGNRLTLDTVPDILTGTGAVAPGRPYSIRDLITMLNVRITVNQKEMTAVMFRDY